MEIYLSAPEVAVIKIWADTNIHGGHWGDGDFFVPEEKIILEKLDNIKNGKLKFTKYEAGIILAWSESSRGIYTMEEESVINKLNDTVKMNDGPDI